MRAPDTFRAFEIRITNSWDEVEQVLLVVYFAMSRFMHLWDGWDHLESGAGVHGGRPVLLNALEEVDVPLTAYIIADQDHGNKGELKGGTKDEVHVRIPKEVALSIV